MTGKEFRKARRSVLKVSRSELARLMETPLPTLRDIETIYADTEIKGCYKRLLELLIERDRWVMQAVKEKVALDIARNHPAGIQSAIEREV